MRQSNKRSRSKQNRPRSLGNIVNRVFDSSGPEGKVRGTPQQIIDKYLVLTRDAQLAGDRVAAENFAQHAEHYSRMLHEAQSELAREAEARREQQQNQNQNRRSDGEGDGSNGGQGSHQGHQNNQGGNERRRNRDNRDDRRKARDGDDPRGDQQQGDEESSLVETPESRSGGQRETGGDAAQSDAVKADATPSDEAPAPKKRGRPRKPKGGEEQPAVATGSEHGGETPSPSGRDAAE